jgi:hypothetical protein
MKDKYNYFENDVNSFKNLYGYEIQYLKNLLNLDLLWILKSLLSYDIDSNFFAFPICEATNNYLQNNGRYKK